MENLLLPSKISFEKGDEPNVATFTVEPCYFGYGTTIGNALRRVLLSSLPGAAVIAVKIAGVDQEFSAIENVKEDALTICLNLKDLRVKVYSEEPVKLHLKAKGKKTITAKDFEKNSDVEIINSELEIATLTSDKATIDLEVTVKQGRGYVPTEERLNEDLEIGNIMIDAIFSPVRKVGYKVVPTRVGDITNYDKLMMDIETDGTISPQEAVSQAAKILIEHFSLLTEQGSDKDA
ncbi:MAG: DNA-directed RNA polymerase subunit alpha [Parcubacteria group bacterium GW2011_GWC2_39_14]|nr:MAG: DNA-directed RNA polymerase subunit alpha [Parcubacteria group bacterium GW2011_GWC2_39_14]KKR53296.1 MAG: DNA-directed RNA polymerase subunit alpha [Parcubacteria group bacterium GW2011_GWA2_40_23]